VVDETVVEVLTAQMCVTGGGLDLENAFLDGQERHIDCTSAQVKDENIAFANDLLVQAISNSSCCGLVDDTKDIQARNGTSVFCGLTLGVVAVGWNGNDCVVDRTAKIRLWFPSSSWRKSLQKTRRKI
jgi:hypothetical protein